MQWRRTFRSSPAGSIARPRSPSCARRWRSGRTIRSIANTSARRCSSTAMPRGRTKGARCCRGSSTILSGPTPSSNGTRRRSSLGSSWVQGAEVVCEPFQADPLATVVDPRRAVCTEDGCRAAPGGFRLDNNGRRDAPMITPHEPGRRAALAATLVALTLTAANAAAAAPSPDPARLARAQNTLQAAPLLDGHNDLPWYFREHVQNHLAKIDLRGDTSKLAAPMNTDIARLRRGGLGGQFWAVYVPVETPGAEALQATLEQIDVVHRLVAQYPDVFEIARTADDVERIRKAGRIASLIGMEGGHSIHNSLAALRMLYLAGARYMTITHTANTDWADSATATPQHGGLTRFGEEVIHEMNRLGMLVDLSHVAPETMKKAIAASAAPVIFSHSSCRALVDHPRNVPDEVLRMVPANHGVVMVTFVERFDSEEVRAYDGQAEGEDARLKF